jgi:hypothetical protein
VIRIINFKVEKVKMVVAPYNNGYASFDEIELFSSVEGMTTSRLQKGHSETDVLIDALHLYGKAKIGIQPRGISAKTLVNFFVEYRYGDNSGEIYVDANRTFVLKPTSMTTELRDTSSSIQFRPSRQVTTTKTAKTYRNDAVFSGINLHVEQYGTLAVPGKVSFDNVNLHLRGRLRGVENFVVGFGANFYAYQTASTEEGSHMAFSFQSLNVQDGGHMYISGDAVNVTVEEALVVGGIAGSLQSSIVIQQGAAAFKAGDIVIGSSGVINATGSGYISQAHENDPIRKEVQGPGYLGRFTVRYNSAGHTTSLFVGHGGSHGGRGASWAFNTYPPHPELVEQQRSLDKTGYDDTRHPKMMGSAGTVGQHSCLGGAGGGALGLHAAGAFVLDGVVEANGQQGMGNQHGSQYSSGGGGAGGAIDITATSLRGSGVARVNGGRGGLHTSGWKNDYRNHAGGGGGGRIGVHCIGPRQFTGRFEAFGGIGGPDVNGMPSAVGGQGTIYEDCGSVKKRLTVDNNKFAPQLPSYFTEAASPKFHPKTTLEIQQIKMETPKPFSLLYGLEKSREMTWADKDPIAAGGSMPDSFGPPTLAIGDAPNTGGSIIGSAFASDGNYYVSTRFETDSSFTFIKHLAYDFDNVPSDGYEWKTFLTGEIKSSSALTGLVIVGDNIYGTTVEGGIVQLSKNWSTLNVKEKIADNLYGLGYASNDNYLFSVMHETEGNKPIYFSPETALNPNPGEGTFRAGAKYIGLVYYDSKVYVLNSLQKILRFESFASFKDASSDEIATEIWAFGDVNLGSRLIYQNWLPEPHINKLQVGGSVMWKIDMGSLVQEGAKVIAKHVGTHKPMAAVSDRRGRPKWIALSMGKNRLLEGTTTNRFSFRGSNFHKLQSLFIPSEGIWVIVSHQKIRARTNSYCNSKVVCVDPSNCEVAGGTNAIKALKYYISPLPNVDGSHTVSGSSVSFVYKFQRSGSIEIHGQCSEAEWLGDTESGEAKLYAYKIDKESDLISGKIDPKPSSSWYSPIQARLNSQQDSSKWVKTHHFSFPGSGTYLVTLNFHIYTNQLFKLHI